MNFKTKASALILAAFAGAGLTACVGTQAQGVGTAPVIQENLQSVIDDHWADYLSRNPTFATSLGVRDHDDRLGDLTLASMDAEAVAARGFLNRLDALDRETLNPDEKLNFDLLKLTLEDTVKANAFEGRAMLLTNRGGWHVGFARLPSRAPFFTLADYESYIARLKDFPRFNREGIATLRTSIETGYVQPCAPMEGYENTIKAHIVEDADASVFLMPFAAMPAAISEADQTRLKADAKAAIEGDVIPAYRELLTFYETEYAPACRDASGVYGLPGAEEYYAYRAERFTTTDMSPEETHELGLTEVERIRGEMDAIVEAVGFEGDRAAFIEFLRTDPVFYPKTGDELLQYTAYISKKADGALPKLFSVLPRMPYAVEPIPEDIAEKTTTAYYERPSGDGTRPGIYRVNLSKLNTRPLFEVEALSLHEAVPGHHLQIALAQELEGIPAFRRYGGLTAFIEGWGLYAERLGLEMGFYEDPYSDFGRLSYEMWRACRLVVDTGLHAKGWSRQQAIDYMADNTALSLNNIEAEVDRYITWPGQALAYKIGELKIRELRARATETLGANFDVRRFHDTVLGNGAVPLSTLEQIIDDWIEAEAERTNAAP